MRALSIRRKSMLRQRRKIKMSALSVDNLAIEMFEKEARVMVDERNELHAAQSMGSLVIRVDGGHKKFPRKKFNLLGNMGTRGRLCLITLISVRPEEGKVYIASNQLLPFLKK